jgi:hypothetical protein
MLSSFPLPRQKKSFSVTLGRLNVKVALDFVIESHAGDFAGAALDHR